MKFDDLLYFFAAAKSNSTSIAAELLHVTQPTISQAIKRLEQELGIQLFNRAYRGIVLTQAGEEVFNIIPNIIDSFDSIKNIASQYQQPNVDNSLNPALPELHIHTQDFLATSFPEDLLADICQAKMLPLLAVSFNNITDLTSVLPYAEKDLALFFISSKDYNITKIPEFFSVDIITTSKLYLITNKNNSFFQNKNSISYEEITAHPIIVPTNWTDPGRVSNVLFKPLYVHGSPATVMHCDCDIVSKIQSIVANTEYNFITFKAFTKSNTENSIKYIPINDSKKYFMIALYKKDHPQIDQIRFLISELKKYV